MSTLKAINFQHPSSATTNIVNDSSGNVAIGGSLTVAGSTTVTGNETITGTVVMGSSFKRNRIINGNMLIDQRNAGASVTVNATAQFFPVDRWYAVGQPTDGVFTVQQVADAPAGSGGTNSLKVTVTTADASIGSTQEYFIDQRIEGYNVSDFEFGASTAKTVTLSFYVKSSVTGSFGARIGNAGSTRTYPFSYTISSANTWEKKTVTIPGDVSGTWLTTNGIGIDVVFSLGVGSSRKGVANTWASANYIAPTGSVDLISTLNATLNVTLIQLEVGSVATPYETQIYSDQLAQCQRYYYRLTAATSYTNAGVGRAYATTNCQAFVAMPVSMRAAPTGSYSSLSDWNDSGGGTPSVIDPISQYSGDYRQMTVNMTGTYVSGQAIALNANNTTNAWMAWSAEL